MRTKSVSKSVIKMVKYFPAASFLLLALIGCSNRDLPDRELRDKSIENFNAGRELEALALAKKLTATDSSYSDFILTQFIIYDTVNDMRNPYRINKKWYESVVTFDLKHVDQKDRDRYIASQIFSEIYLNSADSARNLLAERCKAWLVPEEQACINKIIFSVRDSYISMPNRINASYLIQAAEAGRKLKLMGQTNYEYDTGIAFAAIDKRRSLITLRYLVDKKIVSDEMQKTYCSILKMDFNNSEGQSLLSLVAHSREDQISATCQ